MPFSSLRSLAVFCALAALAGCAVPKTSPVDDASGRGPDDFPELAHDSAAAKQVMMTEAAPPLFKVSKCPDLIKERRSDYGGKLTDTDERALIDFVKIL